MASLILQSLDHCGLNVEKLFVLFKLSQLKQVSLLLWSFRLLSEKVKSGNGSELGKFSQGGILQKRFQQDRKRRSSANFGKRPFLDCSARSTSASMVQKCWQFFCPPLELVVALGSSSC